MADKPKVTQIDIPAIELEKLHLGSGDFLYIHGEDLTPQTATEISRIFATYLNEAGHSGVLVAAGPWDLGVVHFPDHVLDSLAEQLAARVAAIILEAQVEEFKDPGIIAK